MFYGINIVDWMGGTYRESEPKCGGENKDSYGVCVGCPFNGSIEKYSLTMMQLFNGGKDVSKEPNPYCTYDGNKDKKGVL